MQPPTRPPDEEERLRALAEYAVLDTPPEATYDQIARLAANICKTPVARISFVARDREWFKARVGIEGMGGPRDVSFCGHAILDPLEVMVVPDAAKDARFADNPMVARPGGVRFYAGAPILTPGGQAVGTVCVLDTKPRTLSTAQVNGLRALGQFAGTALEYRKTMRDLGRIQSEAVDYMIKLAGSELREANLKLMTAMVAHDLLSPITPVKIQVQILRSWSEKGGPEFVPKALAIMDRNLDTLQRLARDMRDVVRIDNKTFTLEPVPTKLGSLLGQVVEQFAQIASGRGVDVVQDVAVDPKLNLDPTRMLQVMTNLVGNAMKFVPRGGRVKVRLTEAAGQARIDVEDNGVGMSPEQLARLFRPFAQVHDKADVLAAGLGLGLCIAKAILEGHGGTLTASSPGPGKGSTFTAALPLLPKPRLTRQRRNPKENLDG